MEGGPKIRVYIREANAGWIVWSDDAVDALMKASANSWTQSRISHSWGLDEFGTCTMPTVVATTSPNSGD